MNPLLRVTSIFLLLLVANEARSQPIHLDHFANEQPYTVMVVDVLEAAPMAENSPIEWDIFGSVGKQYDRIWIKSDGVVATSTADVEIETSLLYSRLIAPFWEFQAGIRFDLASAGSGTTTRGHLVIGLEGLAPYWFEIEPALFISDRGDLSASLTGTYDLLVTQRAILQPRVDVAASAQDVEEWGVGTGVNSIGLGLRLRYEIRREFAPYLGATWNRLLGPTARMAGGDDGAIHFVFGFRIWR